MERHSFDSTVSGHRHSAYVGWVLGIALRNGLHASPVLDEASNYTDRLLVSFGEHAITVVIPPPPEDWVIP